MILRKKIEFVREQWNKNPLVKLMLAKISSFLRLVIISRIGLSIAGFISTLLFLKFGFGSITMAYSWLIAVLRLLTLIATIIAPFLYCKWAYRKSWTDDQSIRALPISFEERLAAIVLPGIYLVIIWNALGLGLTIVSTMIQAAFLDNSRITWASLPGRWVSDAIGVAIKIIEYGMFAFCITLRRLLQLSGSFVARKTAYAAMPVLVLFGFVILHNVCSNFGPTVGKYLSWKVSDLRDSLKLPYMDPSIIDSFFDGAVQLLIGAGGAYLLFLIYRRMWRHDLQIAETSVFTAAHGGVT
ncbi:MAG: hypothetical protein ABI579_03455 [Candidatus Sumerlaeota bacterium]